MFAGEVPGMSVWRGGGGHGRPEGRGKGGSSNSIFFVFFRQKVSSFCPPLEKSLRTPMAGAKGGWKYYPLRLFDNSSAKRIILPTSLENTNFPRRPKSYFFSKKHQIRYNCSLRSLNRLLRQPGGPRGGSRPADTHCVLIGNSKKIFCWSNSQKIVAQYLVVFLQRSSLDPRFWCYVRYLFFWCQSFKKYYLKGVKLV